MNINYTQGVATIQKQPIPLVMLFYGPQRQLRQNLSQMVQKKLRDSATVDTVVVDGKDADLSFLGSIAQGRPLFTQKTLLMIDNGEAFLKVAANRDYLEAFINRNTDFIHLIILMENKPDLRLKCIKRLANEGWMIQCDTPSKGQMVNWVLQFFRSKGKHVSSTHAELIVSRAGSSLVKLKSELEKLVLYSGEEDLTQAHILSSVIPTLESRIFAYVDALGQKQGRLALETLSDMLMLNEPPLRIFSMIVRQIRLLYMCKLLDEENVSTVNMGKELGLAPFIANKCLSQSKNFVSTELEQLLFSLYDIEGQIKTGRISAPLALELFTLQMTA